MRNRRCGLFAIAAFIGMVTLAGCGRTREEQGSVTMVIESSPTNLDPRIGTDGQSEHIDSLIFDSLVRRDEHFNIQPWLAQSWETPDPLTIVFHLRSGVHFHDGRALTSKDVQYTITSILKGGVPTVKSQAYQSVDHIDAPDPLTAIFHLKKPDVALLPSLSDGAIGIVPAGSGRDFGRHPIGSGPFRFVSQEQDKEVVLERNPSYWGTPPTIEHVRFSVVPDSITRALELQKGSADVGVNALTADQVYALRDDPRIRGPERAGHDPQLHSLQQPGQGPERCPGSPGDRVRDQSSFDCSSAVAGASQAGREPASTGSLGLGLRVGNSRLRSDEGEFPARRGWIEARSRRSALSPDHQDFDR